MKGPPVNRAIHPIERQSYEILRSRLDTSGLPYWTRAVTERVIHASADPCYLTDLVCDEDALAAGAEALAAGTAIVADSAMTAAGITARPVICRISYQGTAELARREHITRSAAGVRLAYEEAGPGAVWVIGTAPTALMELLSLSVRPALVIGLPVGFVGATESKQAVRDSGLPSLTNRGEKGGAAVAAAALNALLYTAKPNRNARPNENAVRLAGNSGPDGDIGPVGSVSGSGRDPGPGGNARADGSFAPVGDAVGPLGNVGGSDGNLGPGLNAEPYGNTNPGGNAQAMEHSRVSGPAPRRGEVNR